MPSLVRIRAYLSDQARRLETGWPDSLRALGEWDHAVDERRGQLLDMLGLCMESLVLLLTPLAWVTAPAAPTLPDIVYLLADRNVPASEKITAVDRFAARMDGDRNVVADAIWYAAVDNEAVLDHRFLARLRLLERAAAGGKRVRDLKPTLLREAAEFRSDSRAAGDFWVAFPEHPDAQQAVLQACLMEPPNGTVAEEILTDSFRTSAIDTARRLMAGSEAAEVRWLADAVLRRQAMLLDDVPDPPPFHADAAADVRTAQLGGIDAWWRSARDADARRMAERRNRILRFLWAVRGIRADAYHLEVEDAFSCNLRSRGGTALRRQGSLRGPPGAGRRHQGVVGQGEARRGEALGQAPRGLPGVAAATQDQLVAERGLGSLRSQREDRRGDDRRHVRPRRERSGPGRV